MNDITDAALSDLVDEFSEEDVYELTVETEIAELQGNIKSATKDIAAAVETIEAKQEQISQWQDEIAEKKEEINESHS